MISNFGRGLLSTSPDRQMRIVATEEFKKSLVPRMNNVEYVNGRCLTVVRRECALYRDFEQAMSSEMKIIARLESVDLFVCSLFFKCCCVNYISLDFEPNRYYIGHRD